MMTESLTAIGPFTQVLTMDGLALNGHLHDEELPIISQAGILIQNGKITAVDSWDNVRLRGNALYEVPYPAVAMPGWIDCHTHICFAGSRASEYTQRLSGATYQQIAASGDGIMETVRQTRKASQEDLESLLKHRLNKQLSLGITTCEIKSGYGLTLKDEIKSLQAIRQAAQSQPISLVPTCLAAHTTPPEFASPAEYLQFLTTALLPQLKQQNLSKRIDIFVEEGAFSPAEARPYLLAAKEHGFSICLHADQFSSSGSLLAAELNALSADHLEHITPQAAQALARSRVIPVVLPGSSLGLGYPFAPAHMLLDQRLPLAIASDWNPGTAPMGNLLTQAALLSAAEHLTTAETFAAVTFRAARALELYDRGILKTSMRADIAVFPTHDFREILYHQGSLTPSLTFIQGTQEFP